MICPSCGSWVDEGDLICPSCGSRIGGYDSLSSDRDEYYSDDEEY